MRFFLQLVLEYAQKPKGCWILIPKSVQQPFSFSRAEDKTCKPWGEQGGVRLLCTSGPQMAAGQSRPGTPLPSGHQVPRFPLGARGYHLELPPSPTCYKHQVVPKTQEKHQHLSECWWVFRHRKTCPLKGRKQVFE